MRESAVFIFVLFLASVLSAQERTNALLIRGNLVFPQGDFADDDGYKDGFTKLGYGGGLEFQQYIYNDELGLFISGDVLVNQFDNEKYEVINTTQYTFHVDDPYINIPLMGGIFYAIRINPIVEFQIKGGGGVNFFTPPDKTQTYEPYPSFLRSYTAKSTTTFGFKLSGSFIVDIFLFEFSYMHLGEAEFEIIVESSIFSSQSNTGKQPISMINLSAGIRL
jgi:hypothetical protein